MSIIRLPESVASRIAAGEVVERPASAVKELVENALDAHAGEISVWVEKSGTALIRVSDDGMGMSSEDVSLAVERHSTSKLRSEADLLRIATLGFRGEALPSIAAVAKMEIVSRQREESGGHRLRVEGGEKSDTAPAGCPPGTTVEVRDLFYNTPARKKFLKAPATELAHICDAINRMALAYPGVHFRLYHDGRLLADYVAVSGSAARVEQVLGREVAAGMAPVASDAGAIKVGGFLSKAPDSYSTSRYLMTYVNRRYVRDRTLSHAVMQGYETLLMKGRYPAAVLFLDVPLAEVDVNVHPAKHEVRFRRQSEVHEAVVDAVRQGLRQEAKAPSSTAARAGAPGEERGARFVGRDIDGPMFPARVSEPAETYAFSGLESRPREGFFSSLRVLGQILGCYVVCACPRGLVVIDQHAAHERVAFEKMRRGIGHGAVERQNLLLPQILELSAGDALMLEQQLSFLDSLGFAVEPFGANGFAVRSVPALLPAGDYRGVVRNMLAEIAEFGRSAEPRQGLEERLMTIACHSVIRANRMLEPDEIRALLSELDRSEFATQCPHGRPVVVEISEAQLERLFKRT